MQWLPTYMSRYLGANKESISFTAMPYVINSLVGIGKNHFYRYNFLNLYNTKIASEKREYIFRSTRMLFVYQHFGMKINSRVNSRY